MSQINTLDGYALGRTLGTGASAKVKAARAEDGKEYALKIFKCDNPRFNKRALSLLKQEVEAALQLDHPNISKYYEFKENAIMVNKHGEEK